MQSITLAVLLGALLSLVLTALVRRYALATKLLDHPNARSSHSIPTPRGGGVAIVASFGLSSGWLAMLDAVDTSFAMALFGAGGLVALLGFFDDRFQLRAGWRFLGHLVSAVWALWALHGIPPVPLFGHSIDLGWPGLALAAVYLVWMVNLCNFMDGIDGIASIEAITVSLGGAFAWWLATGTSQWCVPILFAACVAGFLVWNYPPARIFMGDAGSGFVGMVLGLFSLWAGRHAPAVFWCWFILLGCFMVDATTTLIRRVRRGERFSEAHRSHAYQFASRLYRSHKRVSLAVGAINLLWLLPIAVLVALGKLDGAVGTIIAYVPLVVLAFRLKAGDRVSQGAMT